MTTETNEPARKPLGEVDENTFLWDLVRWWSMMRRERANWAILE